MRKPSAPQTIMEKSVTSSAPKMPGFRACPVQRALAYQPIIAPIMKTSPWAKLISLRTPYTIV